MRYPLLVAALVVPALLSAQQPAGRKEAPGKGARAAARHLTLTPDRIDWKAGPAALPAGAQAAVIDGDPAKPGLFTMRLKLPDGYRIPPHFHAASEHVTVISGSFAVGQGSEWREGEGTVLEAGGFAVMPPGMRHYAWTRGETVVQVHAMGPWKLTYVNKADDPRTKPKEAARPPGAR